MLFNQVIDETADNPHPLHTYENPKTNQSILSFWKRLIFILEI